MAAGESLENAIAEMAAYRHGRSRKALVAVEKIVRDSHGETEIRTRIRKRLAALLGGDATADCKRFVCRQLSIIGTSDEVPALAALLDDGALSHMARFALERIPGDVALEALRGALGRLKGKLLVGVINSLGERRDGRAVEALARLVGDRDIEVACAAAAALGKIGGSKAARALETAERRKSPRLRQTAVDASLACAETLAAAGNKDEAARIYKRLAASGLPEHVRHAARRGLETVGRG